jgi:hypothetical protein
MTLTIAARSRFDGVRLVVVSVARGATLVAIATYLILTLLPAALGAAGPGVPIAG